MGKPSHVTFHHTSDMFQRCDPPFTGPPQLGDPPELLPQSNALTATSPLDSLASSHVSTMQRYSIPLSTDTAPMT